MSIRVVCPNGHVLNVRDDLAGKIGLCPTCKARVEVPESRGGGLSEEAIMGILGPPVARPLHPELAPDPMDLLAASTVSERDDRGPPMKSCEKCGQLILAGTHICPHCHTYIGRLEDF
jgi:hypothetical protein